MPYKDYHYFIDEDNLVFVQFTTEKGTVLQFVVKYYSRIGDQWREIVRYDSGHDCPHKDVLLPDGGIIRKIWYEYMDNAQALTFAMRDVLENYQFYLERFRKWLKND